MQASPNFRTSYTHFENYPRSLIDRPLYDGTGVSYKQQLSKRESTLLEHESSNKIEIKIRDLDAAAGTHCIPTLALGLSNIR